MNCKPTFSDSFLRDLLEGRFDESPVDYDGKRIHIDQMKTKFSANEVVISLCWHGKELAEFRYPFGWKDAKAGDTFTFDMSEPSIKLLYSFRLTSA